MSRLPKVETVIKFARKVVPKGWQVEKFDNALFQDILDGKRKGFFIFPYLRERDYRAEDIVGRVEYMTFQKGSSWVGLWIFNHPKIKYSHWRATVVHELAHIAVDRLFAMRNPDRIKMGIINSVVDLKKMGEDMHGKYFVWAYELLCDRLGNMPGNTNEISSYIQNIADLNQYKERIKKTD